MAATNQRVGSCPECGLAADWTNLYVDKDSAGRRIEYGSYRCLKYPSHHGDHARYRN